jgi:hypothetical protein
MSRQGNPWCVGIAFGVLCAAQASAQETGGVASSGMAQGEAVINVRSDVKMAIKGTRATTTDRIDKLGKTVTDSMPDIRACYRELAAKRPTTVGSLRVEITLEQGTKDVSVQVTEQAGSDRELTGCVKKVLGKLPLQRLERPSAAIVTLEFSNSRAAGQGLVNEAAAKEAQTPVSTAADGRLHSQVVTGDGKVGFDVSGDSKLGEEGVRAVLLALKSQFAGFLDCRRRSNKNGLSPAGEVEADLTLQRGGKANVKIGRCTVAHERAPICVERALEKVNYESAPPGKRAKVRVTFAE